MYWPGTKKSIQHLVEAHYQAIYRYAYRLSGSAAEAEDLTQDAFCQAQAKLSQLRDWEKARAWLFTILRNSYLHRRRANKTEKQVSLHGAEEVVERAIEPPPEVDPAQLQEALNELPEIYRIPIILFYFEEFTYRDIADQMGLPLGTVMSRLARAKEQLRSRLQPGLALGDGRRSHHGL
jgi:RNA polymerase sigma factor (sigma-70 family)